MRNPNRTQEERRAVLLAVIGVLAYVGSLCLLAGLVDRWLS